MQTLVGVKGFKEVSHGNEKASEREDIAFRLVTVNYLEKR